MKARNPFTGTQDFEFAPTTTSELQALALELRRNSQDASATLAQWADNMSRDAQAVDAALTADTGRASMFEVQATIGMLRRWSAYSKPNTGQRPSVVPGITIASDSKPYGLVAVISPWNFPLLLSLIDAAPALAAGCAVIVKPSEVTPRFVDAAEATVPAGLPIRFARGDGETGQALIDLVDAVCFTGSVATGRLIAKQCAANFIPAFLELGGKDAAIVLEDADIEHAAKAIFWGATSNGGQACQSIERVYVHANVADELTSQLVKHATDPGFIRTPIIADKQHDVLKSHLDDAQLKGATVLAGGEIYSKGGDFCEPTVLTNVDHSMLVMTEETFGPIIPVMSFRTTAEAVALANDSSFGLSAAVFSRDVDQAIAVAKQLDAGAVSINDASLTAFVNDAEKHSFKNSGLGGSRMGDAAIKRFFRSQAFLINEQSKAQPWWYPHLLQ